MYLGGYNGEYRMNPPLKSNIRILVVEDSRTQAEFLRHILETDGYQVILAENGIDALEKIAVDLPAIILSDIIMPEMDGYEFSSRIKQDPRTAAIPVILVSQLFDPADVIRGLEAGADDFIIKPYEPEYIQSRIRVILDGLPHSIPEPQDPPLEISAFNNIFHISAGRAKILQILLSTYDVAVRKNVELEEAREQVNAVNEQIQQAIADLRESNSHLMSENCERRKVEKALDEANKKLNLMASITRHDVINQLTSQNESLKTALSLREKDPQKAWEHVTNATAIATRALNSVKFTRDYQKVGVKSPQWQKVHVLVQAAAKEILPENLVFVNEIPHETEIFADPLIGKVFSNLVENAVKYGGKITTIKFCLQNKGADTIILCQDDGIGIPSGRKDKIFSYEEGMNSGLGLYLAREILAITGIALCETGTAGAGACFEIQCPAATIRNTGYSSQDNM